jgi:lycopene beta-cyclase
MKLIDFVIIGSGCAGLAVARELASVDYLGSVLLVDAKQQFENDKSWSFWATADSPWFSLAPYRWQYSTLSTADKNVSLCYQDYRYCMLPSIDYYDYCVNKLTANTQIRFNTLVNDIHYCDQTKQYLITLADSSVIAAKHVLDTRPIFNKPRYYQQFKGIEVELDSAISAPESVRLMEHMHTVDKGILFFYILPLSATRILIEPTYFGTQHQDYQWLESLAFDWLKENQLTYKKIIRTEQGILPMGGVTTEKVSYDLGGIAANNLKGASGYGFLNIQKWSTEYVYQLTKTKQAAKKPTRLQLLHLMDDLFIDVLITKPILTPQLMMSTAMALPDDKFAKFMTEQSNWSELAHLLAKFPKLPFLKALYLRTCRTHD